ncbi:DUF305 domain-containing protein [Mycolicibacterium sediminis]|uniref:DUF305 domain-containing protein n=1 Tax=Mycolicibacterium sediminis TaxID=1286180 RepID=A0A7I7QMY7_9MYCO|nr:DUF305 domain-containing protein [Mycolicibacterium sediminis]BBY27380.1 hypothetical protein MSEDJ_14760 [Mycolicibacterium sediminis]
MTPTPRLLALAAAFAAVLFVSGCTETPASDGHTDHTHGASEGAQPAAFNDADVTFAKDMIPHHEQAVEMSALVPDRSSDPAVVELAAAISKAQEPEVGQMQAFLKEWTGSSETGHEGHDMGAMNMQGMVDGATMEKLKTLKGADFDTLWLRSMIGHHEGAIAMAKTEIADGADADAKKLAESIVDAQQSEIAQMKSMLGE